MLIDTHGPALPCPESKPSGAWPMEMLRLSWRLVLGLALVLVSGPFPPVEAYALLLAACVLIGRGLGVIVQSTLGLKDHRQ
jgi:hypothetical protein